jgi:hypothetical protein
MDAYDHLIFFHIYKCGGTTLNNIIKQQYKPEAYFHFDKNFTANNFANLGTADRKNIRMLAGHQKFGLHAQLPGTVKYFTMLRDPVKRIQSLYTYIRNNKNVDLHNIIPPAHLENIDVFAEHINDYSPIHGNNGMTRLISGANYRFNGNDSWSHLVPASSIPESDLFEAARANIEKHFVFVGIMEDFDTSIILLAKILNWGNIYYKQRNISQKKEPTLSEDSIAMLRVLNEQDEKLYRYVQEKIAANKAEHSKYLESQKQKLRIRNTFYKLYKKVF